MSNRYLELCPRLVILLERANTDWGEAPKYNEAYRKIRWPGNNLKVVHTNGRPINPTWLSLINYQIGKKSRGTWKYHDIRSSLYRDITTCMRENIPFKTKSVEYKPKEQTLYVNGRPTIKYDLEDGTLYSFTYSGVYNKVVSLILRLFDIRIKMLNRKLTLMNTEGEVVRIIDINTVYVLPKYQVDITKKITNSLVQPAIVIDHELLYQSREAIRVITAELEGKEEVSSQTTFSLDNNQYFPSPTRTDNNWVSTNAINIPFNFNSTYIPTISNIAAIYNPRAVIRSHF